jgi:hypothetical protein
MSRRCQTAIPPPFLLFNINLTSAAACFPCMRSRSMECYLRHGGSFDREYEMKSDVAATSLGALKEEVSMRSWINGCRSTPFIVARRYET